MKPCIVYGLYSTRSPDELRYIGQTTQPLSRRLNQHRNYSKAKITAVHKWFAREIAEGFDVEIRVLRNDAVFNITEIEAIAEHRAKGARLLNLTDGGEGTLGWHGHAGKPKPWMAEINRARCLGKPGRPMSPENKAKLIAAVKARDNTYLVERNKTNHPWRGKRHSEETKAKQSAALTGRVFTEEWLRKIREAKRGKPLSRAQIDQLAKARQALAEKRKNAESSV